MLVWERTNNLVMDPNTQNREHCADEAQQQFNQLMNRQSLFV